MLEKTADGVDRHGVILVSAAPGQGLTSTLTTLLKRHDAYTCNIKTLERDVQRIEGVDHAEWDPVIPTTTSPPSCDRSSAAAPTS